MTTSPILPAHPTRPAAAGAALSPKNYLFLQTFIKERSGIVVEADKHYLLEARLLPLVRHHKLDGLDALATHLATRPASPLAGEVIEAMTTNETLFFRDVAMFDALRTKVLPGLFTTAGRSRPLRIWSAAASTGQEAFSIAMLLLEMGKTARSVEILATDLDTQVLARAREGVYQQFDVNRGLPASYLMKYFSRKGLQWQLQEQVRSMVSFQQFDLRRDCRPLGMFDLILCRNVLIYFDNPTKSRIVEQMRSVLTTDAMLVLGCAETVLNIHTGFNRVTHGNAAFYVPR